jgi:hypothetical protein
MSLRDYDVKRDKFVAREDGEFAFPCCVCVSKRKGQHEEPCRTCDHNVNAVKDTANAVVRPSDSP